MTDVLPGTRVPGPGSRVQLGNEFERFLPTEAATIAFGRELAAALPAGGFAIALYGSLGAGKSTLARSLLRALGVEGAVPSPTYTLIEPYTTTRGPAYHIDLYRLQTEAEVQTLGLEDEVSASALVLVEWPEHGAEGLFDFDLAVTLEHADAARLLSARALTPAGIAVLARLRAVSP